MAFLFERRKNMVTRKEKGITVLFNQKLSKEGNELWRSRFWDEDGPTYLVLDMYPNIGNTHILDESLTDMLTAKQLRMIGARGYYLFHTFSKQPTPVNNKTLGVIDRDSVAETLKEFTKLVKEIDEVIIVSGQLGQRYENANDRMKQFEEILKDTKTPLKKLIDPTTGNPSSPTYRKVREGSGVWQLQ